MIIEELYYPPIRAYELEHEDHYGQDNMYWKTKAQYLEVRDPRCFIDFVRSFALQYMSKEAQEIVIGFLLMIGLWTATKWIAGIIFSIMWPLFLLLGIILTVPTWRQYITDEYLPDNFNIIDTVTKKLSNCNYAQFVPQTS